MILFFVKISGKPLTKYRKLGGNKSAVIRGSNESQLGESSCVSAGQDVSPIQWVVTVYRHSIHDIHPLANAPHAADRGRPVQRGLVLPCSQHMVDPRHLLLPLGPKAVRCQWDPSGRAHPALLAEIRTLLLVVLLPVGNTADGTMGGAFVDVLVWHFLFLPIRSILGQCAAQAAPQGARGRHRDGEEGLLLRSCHRRWDRLLVCLTQ